MRSRRPPGFSYLVCIGVLLAALANASGTSVPAWEIDETAKVTRVVDGDTFIADPGGRVRLADIDAPETGEPGAGEAIELLSSFVHRKWVYLGLDDLHGRDSYGRLVAVTYVRHNATHLLNVNQALLDAGIVEMKDFSNEFDPGTWTPYVFHPVEHPGADDVPLAAWMLGAGFIALETWLFAALLWAWREDRRPR